MNMYTLNFCILQFCNSECDVRFALHVGTKYDKIGDGKHKFVYNPPCVRMECQSQQLFGGFFFNISPFLVSF